MDRQRFAMLAPMDRLEQIAATYAFQQSCGHGCEDTSLARYVRSPALPDIWVANHVSLVRAQRADEIDMVLERTEQALAHCAHRMFIVDALTPPAFIARLALEGYIELSPTLHMVLELELHAEPSHLELRPVERDEDWEALYDLLRANHLEKLVHGLSLREEITRGIVAAHRAKAGAVQFFLAIVDGAPRAYGSSIVAPYGMGIVEDLFTLPAYRKRGLATALIANAIAYGRDRGMRPMLIGAFTDEPAKALYASLGFQPVCLTRQYVLDRERHEPSAR
jgi:GNAT superfamily N-acetyltransferase